MCLNTYLRHQYLTTKIMIWVLVVRYRCLKLVFKHMFTLLPCSHVHSFTENISQTHQGELLKPSECSSLHVKLAWIKRISNHALGEVQSSRFTQRGRFIVNSNLLQLRSSNLLDGSNAMSGI